MIVTDCDKLILLKLNSPSLKTDICIKVSKVTLKSAARDFAMILSKSLDTTLIFVLLKPSLANRFYLS